jgi:type II secretory pathway component GspD/PulD (secretin)
MGATQNYSAKIFTTNIILQQTWVTNHGNVMENTSIVPQATQLKVGPVLDVIPYVLSDGYTINLTLIPSLTQILVGSNSVPEMLPDFRIRHVVSTLNLRDGQTAIIGGLPEKDYVNGKEVFDKSKSSDKELLVFITVTLVDPAGNRLHSDGDMPFAKNGIPAQPKH